jgi:CBS domain-containing protein
MSADTTVAQLLENKGDKVYSITSDATVFDALTILSEAKIGVLPVIDDAKLVGIFSERDYARKLILEGKASKDTKIKDVMTAGVVQVTPQQTVKECMALMSKNHFRHLPVVADEKVVGVISMSDIVRAILMSLL